MAQPRQPRGQAGKDGQIGVGTALGRDPDQLQALLAFDLDQGGVDRGGEARVVQLDREVVAVLLGALLPGRTELDILRCTAKRRLC